MSYCRDEGKDQIIFATKEDLDKPVSALIRLEEDDEDDEPGLILPDGDINWNCPCLGGMATGPCGVTFREAFSCFHYSQADPKGSECYEQFRSMQDCMTKFPELYPAKDDDEDDTDLDEAELEERREAKKAVESLNDTGTTKTESVAESVVESVASTELPAEKKPS